MTWNILHGGGPRRLPEIILALLSHQPHVVVLTEFRATRGSQIRGVLADHGLEHQLTGRGGGRVNGLLLASRTPVHPEVIEGAPCQGRWLGATLPEHALTLGCVHVPDDTQGADKGAYWEFLLRAGRLWIDRNVVFLGDFNTSHPGADGGPKGQRCVRQLKAFLGLGYADAWRSRNGERVEFSWFSHQGQGWRIDTAYVSPSLGGVLQRSWYSQVEREQGHSDHAPLLLDLALPGGQSQPNGTQSRVRAGLFATSAEPDAARQNR